MTTQTQFQVHVRYDGRSYEFTNEQLDLGDLSTDDGIRNAVASELGANASQLDNYVVEREPTGNITLRPQAVFG